MSDFVKYRVFFNIDKINGLLQAHSGAVTWERFEEYRRVYECGSPWPSKYTGDLYWQADPPQQRTDKNSRRLAREFLEKHSDEFPTTAARVRWMLEKSDEDHRHQPTLT